MTNDDHQKRTLIFLPTAVITALVLCGFSCAYAQRTMEEFTSYPFPSELTTSVSGNRMAVAINKQGQRNLYVAEGPAFELRKLTHYDDDIGDEITNVQLSFDGQWVVYVKGGDHGGRNSHLPRNPSSLPLATNVQVWSMPFIGGDPILLGEGDRPVISPSGDLVAFIHQGQIWAGRIDGSIEAEQLCHVRGSNGSLQWSPDGSALAFVSSRGSHSLIGVYRNQQTPIQWIAPEFAKDSSPRWSPDGKRIAFIRQEGVWGAPDSILGHVLNPWAIWVAGIDDGVTTTLWNAPSTPQGAVPTTHGGTNLHWVGKGRIAFVSYHDGWPHLYSVPDTGGSALLLTPGKFMVEHIKPSPCRQYLLASANTGPNRDDIDRRHVIAVSVDKADMRVITTGEGIETFPSITGDGKYLVFLSATAIRPPLPAVLSWPRTINEKMLLLGERLISKTLANGSLSVPRRIEFNAADGETVYGQLFEPANSTRNKPAVVFIHGGPQRQMLLGWHYGDYYANTYALNQYLVSRGFVVLSANYRLGIGYGFDFHKPLFAGQRGAVEYQDIKAAGEWLAKRPDVDATRIGVYGGSYGGFLTALALGRDSDLFAAGVDIHGVHNFMERIPPVSVEPASDISKAVELARISSPVFYTDTWRSPVLFIHGDDDANVDFQQTIDLLNRLKDKKVRYETLVIPDETHHWMVYSHLLQVNRAVAEFLEKHLRVGM